MPQEIDEFDLRVDEQDFDDTPMNRHSEMMTQPIRGTSIKSNYAEKRVSRNSAKKARRGHTASFIQEGYDETEGDPDNKHIIIKYEKKAYPVNWNRETSPSDVRDSVVCACDSICDSEFTLVHPDQGEVKLCWKKLPCPEKNPQFHELLRGNSQIFDLFKSKDVANGSSSQQEKLKAKLTTMLGDRKRKLDVQVTPFNHAEAVKAVKIL